MITLHEYNKKLLIKGKQFNFEFHGVEFKLKVHESLLLCKYSKDSTNVSDNKLFTTSNTITDVCWYIVNVVNNLGYNKDLKTIPNIDCNIASDKLMELIDDRIATVS